VGRRVNIDDLVDARGVAELLGLKHSNSVSTYAKRYEDFPRPIVNLGRGRTLLWLQPEIVAWARATGRI
jgi:predicted DNA-binding transcriptional regulator AlpA